MASPDAEGQPKPPLQGVEPPPSPRWPAVLAGAMIVGILAGRVWPAEGFYLVGAGLLWVAAVVAAMRGGHNAARALGYGCVAAASAAWLIASDPAVELDPSARAGAGVVPGVVPGDGMLVDVAGRVAAEPWLAEGSAGPFAVFAYQPPVTRFRLELERARADGRWHRAGGVLLVRIDEADHRVRLGQRVRVRGWYAPIDPPANAGEFDYRRHLQSQGVIGRLRVPLREHWRLLDDTGSNGFLQTAATWFNRTRQGIADRADAALRLGLLDNPQTLGLVQTLLLGKSPHDIDGLRERFREVGLAHLLSISGAHLGILMAMVWLLVRLAVPHPPRAALLVLAILGLYLLAVPLRVPVVRASIMAGAVFPDGGDGPTAGGDGAAVAGGGGGAGVAAERPVRPGVSAELRDGLGVAAVHGAGVADALAGPGGADDRGAPGGPAGVAGASGGGRVGGCRWWRRARRCRSWRTTSSW